MISTQSGSDDLKPFAVSANPTWPAYTTYEFACRGRS
jgi:hypothetical protein